MRIAALIATENVSGPGRQLAALAQRLADDGVAMRVLLFNRHLHRRPPFAEHLARAGVAYDIIADRGALDWSMVGAARRHIEADGATIVQTHGYKATAIGYALQRTGGRSLPWIGCFHGTTNKGLKDRIYHGMERRMLRAADRIIVVSRTQSAHFPRCSPRLRVIDNAIIPPHAGETLLRTASAIEGSGDATVAGPLPAAGQRPRLGVIGRLSPEKGVDVFLRACDILRERGRRFSAVIVGDGPEEEGLRQLTQRLRLDEYVHFAGHVDAVAGLYEQLDLVVLPSRSEGLPNVLLEALLARVPVVATAVGAVPDVLGDPAAGTVVRPDDPRALADGITAALAAAPGDAAARARAAILDRYSLDRRVEQHLRIYRELTVPAEAVEAA
jgi:glycosyltransferase involved in cell wall biosynthesis